MSTRADAAVEGHLYPTLVAFSTFDLIVPGLCGVITGAPRQEAERELQRMQSTLRHEAFYEAGTWTDESLGLYLGWTARKDSFADRMPITNEDGSVVMLFSGEEFSGQDVRPELRLRGHSLGDQEPSYLVHLYEDDPEFFSRLNGIFHGVVIDRNRGIATLFNDRFGMHRIYFHQTRDAFYFAAEAKAILAARPELRSLDRRSFAEFIACGCVLENRTLFQQINTMPGGAAWTIRGGSPIRKDSYFHPSTWEQQAPLDAPDYYRELRRVLERNLPHYFDGRSRIGVALTGGLDTRLIMSWRGAAPAVLPCYTFGSMFRENQDVRVARRVARVAGQPHEVLIPGREFLSRFPYYASRSVYLTDGVGELTHAPDLYLSEKARAIAPTKVVGTYGSEILTAAPAFKPITPAKGLYSEDLETDLRRATTTYAEARGAHSVTFAAFRQSPWWHFSVLALEQTQLTVRSPFLDNDFVKTAYQAPIDGSERDLRSRLIADGNPALARIRSDRGVSGANDLSGTLCRAFLAFTLRGEYAYDYAMPQWLAKADHLLSPLKLERLFLGRHKAFHFRVWYRDSLAPYVRDILLDPRTLARPFFQRKTVNSIVNAHVNGQRNHTTTIHRMLTLELLHRQFVDGQSASA